MPDWDSSVESMLEISSESQQFPAHDLAQRPILVFAPRMDTLGVSYASHSGMKDDNTNIGGRGLPGSE